MKRIKIGLNGFGRIGRAITRIAHDRNEFEIVAINTRSTKADMMAYLLKYDSLYRTFHADVSHTDHSIHIDGREIATLQIPEIADIPWDQYGVDVVVDCTGAYTKKVDLEKHIKGSVKKVILTAPAKDDETPHVVLGVNDATFDFSAPVISNASCTTNCAAPLFKILQDAFGVTMGSATTCHAYTATQSLVDESNKEKERSRAAALNIVPSSSGASKAVVKVIPELKGKIEVMSLRVPVATVSFTDLTVMVEKETSVEEVHEVFKRASEESMKGILGYSTETLVSSDYIGSPFSCVYDANYTKVTQGRMIKICGWYDNEWGYSARVVDLVTRVSDLV